MSNKIAVKKLKNGMILGEPIYGEDGQIMIQKGIALDDHYIDYLENHEIESILVFDKDYLSSLKESDKSKRAVEETRIEDPKTIEISDAVKEQIGQGVQYLFNNAESDSFVETTMSITNELTNAVIKNNAIAIDIAQLKTSDEYTFRHSVDVASLSMIIAKTYGLSDKEIENIGIAGLLHDMGKSKIPLEILNKPGRLNDKEFDIMKTHTTLGYRILENTNGFDVEIRKAVLMHHEKTNGKGYPLGVDNNKIPIFAKILSVADVYDALVTERPYKRGFLKKDAIEIIMSMSEELDLNVMHSFLSSIILYPVDSIVQLSNGEFARVVENYKDYPLRPKIVNIKTGEIYDLKNDFKCQSLVVL